MATLKPVPVSVEWTIERLEKSIARYKKLVQLQAPELVLENEKTIMLNFIDRLPKAPPEVMVEIEKARKQVAEEQPKLIDRAAEMYLKAGNTVPWDDLDATDQNRWYAKAVDEALNLDQPDEPPQGLH